MRRTLAGLTLLLATTGCTRAELAAWVAWHAEDPEAAVALAQQPEVAADLASGAHEAQAAPEPEPVRGVWASIAWCESGGRWDHPPVTNRSGTYSGGLMIGHRWWPSYGGTAYAPAPYQASEAEQIAVAENIAADVGLDRGWQCYP